MFTLILTGGMSRRMGRDKATLDLNGEAMSLLLARRFAVLGEVAFAVNRAGRFDTFGFAELVDRYPDQGPLNGLVSAYYGSAEEFVLLMATDMPALSVEAAHKLMDSIGGHDACIYGDEPLFGLYRRRCLPLAEEQLKKGNKAMRDFLRLIDVLRLETADSALFSNLNTPEEYRRYQSEHK